MEEEMDVMASEVATESGQASVRLLTVFEVAKLLQVCVRTVRSYIGKGMLKVRRIGRAVRVEESEIARFIAALPQGKYGE